MFFENNEIVIYYRLTRHTVTKKGKIKTIKDIKSKIISKLFFILPFCHD